MLRVKPTDPYVIEKLSCTTGEWEQWYPGDGTSLAELTAVMREGVNHIINQVHGIQEDTDPAPEQCVAYDLILPGNGQVLLPVHIGTGDTITITNAKGQVSQEAGLPYVLAYYPPSGATVTADDTFPLPGENEMRLIMNIGGVWYDAFNRTDFVIPPGIAQDNLIFMVNDSVIADNVGTFSFHVEICKAADTGLWTKTFNFAISEAGWQAESGPLSSWLSGEGWQTVDYSNYRANDIFINLGDTITMTIVTMTVRYARAFTDWADPGNNPDAWWTPDGNLVTRDSTFAAGDDGSFLVWSFVPDAPVTTHKLGVYLYAELSSGSHEGTSLIRSVTLQGTDEQPDWVAIFGDVF